jgi:hypothetical protein
MIPPAYRLKAGIRLQCTGTKRDKLYTRNESATEALAQRIRRTETNKALAEWNSNREGENI